MRTEWTEEEKAYLKDNYNKMFAKDIATHLGRTLQQVYCKAHYLGLKKDFEYHSIAGKMGTTHPAAMAWRFSKGHVPMNKGKKLPDEWKEKLQATFFKPGHRPSNFKPVGSERVNVDGYIEVKVADPRTWKLKHRVVWEQANGKIPRGYNIQFKDHNTQNCDLDNLYIISRAEQMKTENCLMVKYPPELQEVIRMKGRLKRVINNRKKDEQQ